MTFEEFSDKYEAYLLKLTSKKDFPRWFDIQLKTQGSRNITIDTWNRVITLLGYVASDDHASTELLDDIVKVLNTLKEQLSDKLDIKHFTSSDAGKFVAIGPDGSFVAVYPPSGGEGGGSGGILFESDPTVPNWAKQPNKPTYTASEVGAATPDSVRAETLARENAVNDIKSRAIGAPVLSGQVLSFSNLNGEELGRIDIPEGNSGGAAASVASLPIEHVTNSFTLKKVSDTVYGARVWFEGYIPSCYSPYVQYFYCSNFTECAAGLSNVYVSVTNSYIHTRNGVYQFESDDSIPFPIPLGSTIEWGKNNTGYYLHPDTLEHSGYKQDTINHSWYVELEFDRSRAHLIIKAFQCENDRYYM